MQTPKIQLPDTIASIMLGQKCSGIVFMKHACVSNMCASLGMSVIVELSLTLADIF